MNVVNKYGERRNGFTEVVAFCHVTCRYFDIFLLQGVDRNWRQAYFLNQARAGLRPARSWFLKIDPVRIVCMRACVCLRARGY